WRKKAIKELVDLKPKTILDVATGTADFAIEALSLQPEKIVGIDLSEGMLSMGRIKLKDKNLNAKIELIKGDSEKLPFDDNKFDASTVAFGVRNFEHLQVGLNEIYRVLKPGGKIVVLEFSKPKNFPVKQVYQFYFKYILPMWGKLITKHETAYSYLPASVNAFPEGDQFLAFLTSSGFKQVYHKPLTFGICSIYTGIK
ncbi:MAG: ubiquinone/menaquinone biosynthesis methyltransferase, partial [Bacteroidetes bacterium]|nr:ubiquinone/menaquinone biosynthesis methyltransferase [Bacteroidota bacterium]